ncbi:MAG TPA: ankyrin repeat domain-containing protein [Actinomycetota bacterium]|jgi:ankyrin repeat protein|nr:ankyrin repeat domain-containing protein [Actinomycetota bacterium]
MASTTELFEAIDSGDLERVRSIVASEPSVAEARDEHGVSALMRAVYRLDKPLAQAILPHVPELDVFEAASFGDLDRLTTLLTEDPSFGLAHSGDGFTALHFAAFFGRHEAAELLLARGADVDARGTGWMTGTPLHSAASAGHTDAIRVLLGAGADPDARQSHGFVPLHAAAQNGSVEDVELLLRHGADPSLANDDGSTALDLTMNDAVRARLDQANA